MQTNMNNVKPIDEPKPTIEGQAVVDQVTETGAVTEDGQVHFFITRSNGARRSTGAMPSTDERTAALKELKRLESEGATTTEAVEHLLERNWSTAAIKDVVRYPTDTRGHKRGDMLLPQHVNAIRTRWMQKKQAEEMMKRKAEAAN